MTKILKVDRTKSVIEAKELEELGANFIGVSLFKDLRFDDDRNVDFKTAISIKNSLKAAKCVCEISFKEDSFSPMQLIVEAGFEYVQLPGYNVPPQDIIAQLKSERIKIICSGITASHDDDPSWILSNFLEQKELSDACFQIDLLPEYKNAWEFLKNESPDYPEELQIEDINQLAEEHKLLISLDYSANNVLEVIHHLPNIEGISLILGRSRIEDLHCFEYSKVLLILREIGFNV
jgi:hypothetical protein